MRNNIFRSKKIVAVFMLALTIMIVCIIMANDDESVIKERIINATNKELPYEGECEIDLNVLFADYDWDMVSIFIGGNSKQIREELKIDNDISDGIMFSKRGEPMLLALSTYDFIDDKVPDVGFYVERNQTDDPYYISRERLNALVHVRKFCDYDGTYKYLVYFE